VRIVLTVGVAFVIMNLATFMAYGSLAAILGLEPPVGSSPGQFLASVLVVKLGLAGGFVALYYLAREFWYARWLKYATMWWAMFAVIEVGQAIAPSYSWRDALGGIIAEAIYFPLSALAIRRVLGSGERAAASGE
jgi:hypothetical protein